MTYLIKGTLTIVVADDVGFAEPKQTYKSDILALPDTQLRQLRTQAKICAQLIVRLADDFVNPAHRNRFLQQVRTLLRHEGQ